MRHTLHPQLEIGACQISEIRIDPKSRDDIPAILIGLQHLYLDEGLRARLFDLLEREVLPDVDLDNGRPGMPLWSHRIGRMIRDRAREAERRRRLAA